MLWLSRRPEWQRSREFETTTNSSSPGFYGYRESDNAFTEEERTGDDEVSGKTRMRVVFQPTSDTTHTIFYRGHWLRVRRGRKSNGYEMLSIRYAPNTWLPPISVDSTTRQCRCP
jgi:chaperone BCS1